MRKDKRRNISRKRSISRRWWRRRERGEKGSVVIRSRRRIKRVFRSSRGRRWI